MAAEQNCFKSGLRFFELIYFHLFSFSQSIVKRDSRARNEDQRRSIGLNTYQCHFRVKKRHRIEPMMKQTQKVRLNSQSGDRVILIILLRCKHERSVRYFESFWAGCIPVILSDASDPFSRLRSKEVNE